MYAALETPSRLWKRVQALEREGDQLDELPSLPPDSSEESDFTLDSPRRARSRLLSPVQDENNMKGSAAAPAAKNATPASNGTRSASSTVQASSKTARGHLSPLRALQSRNHNTPKARSPLYESTSSNESSLQSFTQHVETVDGDHSVSHLEEEEQSMSLVDESRDHSRPLTGTSTTRQTSTIPEQDEPDSVSESGRSHNTTNSNMTTGTAPLGLGRPGQPRSHHSGLTAQSDRVPSLTRSTSATHSSPQSSLRSLTASDVQHHDVDIHQPDDATETSDLSQSSNSTRPFQNNRFRLPRAPLSNHSSPAKPMPPPLQSQSAHSSPAIPSRSRLGGGAAGPQTPLSSRLQFVRRASIGSFSTQTIQLNDTPSSQHHQKPDAMATPRLAGTLSDIERRKSHLLATLQLTAKRSQHRAQVNSRTPYRAAANLTMLDGTSSEGGSSAAGAFSLSSGHASDSTNDLNPHANSNHSLPLGDRSTRFNGAKLNSYLHSLNTHLTEENQALSDAVQERDARLQELQEALAEMPEDDQGQGSTARTDLSRSSVRSEKRQKELDDLKGQLQARDVEVAELRRDLLAAQRRNGNRGDYDASDVSEALQKEVYELKDRLRVATKANDEQLEALEAKDAELEQMQSDFAEKMRRLEEELCAVMEEQEGQLDDSNRQVEQLQQERQNLESQLEKVQQELNSVAEERNRFAKLPDNTVDAQEEPAGQSFNSLPRVQALQSDVSRLKDANSQLEQEKKQLEDDCGELESHIEHLEATEEQLKHALQARETELDTLHQHMDKTLQDNKAIECQLRRELEHARQAYGDAGVRMAGVDRASTNELKDQEIATLSQAKAELETRVSALRQQIEMLSAANDVADKTVPFKPIIGIQTPKTPGYFKATNVSSSGYSDMTGVAQPQQIDSLERQVRQLRQQLDNANDELDDKIAKLSRACQSQLDANKELAAVKAKLSGLEGRPTAPTQTAAAADSKTLDCLRDEVDWLEDELKKARQEIRTLSSRRTGDGSSNDDGDAQNRIRELEQEREDLLAGISGLHRDIQRVRLDAVELGKEISSAQGGSRAVFGRSLSAQEAHTLLALVRYLKARVTRENGLRLDLCYQKTYLIRLLDQKAVLVDSVSAVLKKFHLPCLNTLSQEAQQPMVTIKSLASQRWSKVAKVTRAIARMSLARRKWQAQMAEKVALQRAHATARGRSIS